MHRFRKYLRSKKDSLDTRAWVHVQNFVSFCRNRSVRFYHINKMIMCTENHLKIFAPNPKRATLFNNGIMKRINALAESYALEQICFEKDDIIVDIGANIGELGIYIFDQEVSVRYIALEPGATEFRCLRENVTSEDLYNYAAWFETCTIDMYVNSTDADTSLIKPKLYHDVMQTYAIAIDDFFSLASIKLLKLDAEGAEPEVLRGAMNMLKRCDYVAVDTGPERGLNNNETTDVVLHIMNGLGFKLIAQNRENRVSMLFGRNF